jgi:uncharacterized protein YkwD
MQKIRIPALGALAAILVLFGSIVSGPVRPASALSNCDVADLSVDSVELAFLTLINDYRAANGVGTLTISANLNRSASWHAVDMATKKYFSHTDSAGRSSSTRMAACGVASGGVGENIAAGTSWDEASEAFNTWKNSFGHNANMLRSTFKQIGIAHYYDAASPYKHYWVTDFSAVNDGTNLSGGSTTTPPSSPPASVKAAIVSPTPGSTLPGPNVTFAWTAGTGVSEYYLYIGTYRGSNNLYAASLGAGLQAQVYGLPANGSTIYVRLWTLISGQWQYTDYTYRAAL